MNPYPPEATFFQCISCPQIGYTENPPELYCETCRAGVMREAREADLAARWKVIAEDLNKVIRGKNGSIFIAGNRGGKTQVAAKTQWTLEIDNKVVDNWFLPSEKMAIAAREERAAEDRAERQAKAAKDRGRLQRQGSKAPRTGRR